MVELLKNQLPEIQSLCKFNFAQKDIPDIVREAQSLLEKISEG